MAGFYHNDVQTGATVAGLSHCDVQFGRTYNAATLEQSTGSNEVTWGTAPNYWSIDGYKEWARAEFKLTPLDSRGQGNLRVTVYCISGTAPSICIRRGYYNDPDLSGDGSNQGDLTAGNSKAIVGTAPRTYQTGYFCIDSGSWATPYSASLKLTKVEWRVSIGPYLTVWQEGIQGTMNHSCVRFT